MLTFESDATERDAGLYALPLLDFPEYGVKSDLIHEVTHLWSFRNTRLGLAIAAESGILLERWLNTQEPVEPRAEISELLGSLAPLLEGLAIYAQLDYETNADGEPLYTPLAKVAEMLMLGSRALHKPLDFHFRAAREEALFGTPTNEHPLPHRSGRVLHRLFCEDNDLTLHYFVGYLYVKALAAWLARHISAVNDSAWFLPLAIKLLFDAPVIPVAARSFTPAPELLAAIHRQIMSIDTRSWAGIAQLLAQEGAQDWFQRWDIYAQLRSGRFDEPTVFDNEGELEALGQASEARLLPFMHASFDTYLPWWRTGLLTTEGNEVSIRNSNHDERVLIVPMYNLWANAQDKHHQASGQFVEQAHMQFDSALRSLSGKNVTLALFVALSSGTPGLALWSGNQLVSWYPFDATTLFDLSNVVDANVSGPVEPELSTEGEYLLQALALAPNLRRSFGGKVTGVSTITSARWAATEWLEAQLASKRAARDELALRFSGPAFTAVFAEVDRWTKPSPLRRAHAPGRSLVDAGKQLIDLPGFTGEARPISFAELLPRLPPV